MDKINLIGKLNCISLLVIICCSCNTYDNDEFFREENSEKKSELRISSSSSLQYFVNEIAKENKEFAVYTDFGDGRTQFTQKALLNHSGRFPPSMNEKAPSDYGVTCIHVTYPLSLRDWNGYMFITGRLAAGSTSPALDFGEHQTGHDLRGAKRLTFKARGKTGKESVKFYMGGLGGTQAPYHDSDQIFLTSNNQGFITLTKEWKEYSINLENANLSRIGCGFGWVTSQSENTELDVLEFELDEIIYRFDTERKPPLFLRSYEPLPMTEPGASTNNFAYVYDNTLLAIALAHGGYVSYARQVADALVYCFEKDRYYSPGPLRNAYANGSPVSFPGWLSVRNTDFARLPGFYNSDSNEWNEDRYAVSINNGVMCWGMVALMAVYDQTHQAKYLETATRMADYIIEHFSANDGTGGFTGGYEGWERNTEKLTYKSTEHNIDLMSVFKRLAQALNLSNPLAAAKYIQASNDARSFVLSMYDNGCFYTGTLNDGITPSVDNKPLDTNTWAILTLYGDQEVEHLWDPERVYAFIEQTFKTGEGVDYNQDKDGIWNEGTAQLALAALQIGKISEYNRLMRYLQSVTQPDGSLHAASRNGLTTGFGVLSATPNGLVSIPFIYDRRISLASTAWTALAQLRINPYTGEQLGN